MVEKVFHTGLAGKSVEFASHTQRSFPPQPTFMSWKVDGLLCDWILALTVVIIFFVEKWGYDGYIDSHQLKMSKPSIPEYPSGLLWSLQRVDIQWWRLFLEYTEEVWDATIFYVHGEAQ